MPVPPPLLDEDAPDLQAGPARIRDELEVPDGHGPAAVAEVEQAARRVLADG